MVSSDAVFFFLKVSGTQKDSVFSEFIMLMHKPINNIIILSNINYYLALFSFLCFLSTVAIRLSLLGQGWQTASMKGQMVNTVVSAGSAGSVTTTQLFPVAWKRLLTNRQRGTAVFQ